MVPKTLPHSRKLLLASFIILMIVATGCKQNPSRPLLSADEVKSLATKFDLISSEYLQAWVNRGF